MTRMRCASIFGSGAITGVVVAGIALWWMGAPSNRIVKRWHQPKEVDYKSFDPYTLSVIEGTTNWYTIGLPHRHYLFIGRGTAAPDYGHSLDYSFHHGGSESVDAHIQRSAVQWTVEGVTFIAASGHRLFVPRAMFIGGR